MVIVRSREKIPAVSTIWIPKLFAKKKYPQTYLSLGVSL